jgi:hypothetical protein
MISPRVGTIVARRALSSITRKSLATASTASLSTSSNYLVLTGTESEKRNDFGSTRRTFRTQTLAMPVKVVEVSFFRREVSSSVVLLLL